MVEEADGYEAEDEVGVVPIPEVLVKDEKNEEGDKDDSFLVHMIFFEESLARVSRKPFNVSMNS